MLSTPTPPVPASQVTGMPMLAWFLYSQQPATSGLRLLRRGVAGSVLEPQAQPQTCTLSAGLVPSCSWKAAWPTAILAFKSWPTPRLERPISPQAERTVVLRPDSTWTRLDPSTGLLKWLWAIPTNSTSPTAQTLLP